MPWNLIKTWLPRTPGDPEPARPESWPARYRKLGGLKTVVAATALLCLALSIVGLVWSAHRTRHAVADPRIDYLAILNAPLVGVPEPDRAWPLYDQAHRALFPEAYVEPDPLDPAQANAGLGMGMDMGMGGYLRDEPLEVRAYGRRPVDPCWPEMRRLLETHAPTLALIREAARRPRFGVELEHNPDYASPDHPSDRRRLDLIHRDPFFAVRDLVQDVAADARAAAHEGDAARFLDDLEALEAMGKQLDEFDVFVWWNEGDVPRHHLREVMGEVLPTAPAWLDAPTLARLEAVLTPPQPRQWWNPVLTRIYTLDFLQHMFTDDGSGDGRPTRRFIREESYFAFTSEDLDSKPPVIQAAGEAVLALSVPSRRKQLAMYDRIERLGLAERDVPLHVQPESNVRDSLADIGSNPYLRYGPGLWFVETAIRGREQHARVLAELDGLRFGIAWARHRLAFPGLDPHQSLDTIRETLGDAWPLDPITGQPALTLIRDGTPVLYSVGNDRDDDLGAPAFSYHGHIDRWGVQQWQPHDEPADGDWVLYPVPQDPPTELPDPNDQFGMGLGMGMSSLPVSSDDEKNGSQDPTDSCADDNPPKARLDCGHEACRRHYGITPADPEP